MRILITGGGGFIGSNLAIQLNKKFPNSEIFVIDNFSCGVKENLNGFIGEIIDVDIREIDTFRTLLNSVDVIFHLAAITDTTFSNKEEMMDVNYLAFKKILEAIKNKETKLIYASSAAVYGRGSIPMQESQKLQPLNIYAISKSECDKLAIEFSKENTNIVVGLRYFNVYGPNEAHKGRSASMIFQLAKQMLSGRRPRIFKYGEQFRDFIYIDDAIEATILAMNLEKSIIINVGTGKPTSFNEIVKILNRCLNTNYQPEYIDNPYYEFYQEKTLADVELLQKTLNFKPKHTTEEWIKKYVEILQKNIETH